MKVSKKIWNNYKCENRLDDNYFFYLNDKESYNAVVKPFVDLAEFIKDNNILLSTPADLGLMPKLSALIDKTYQEINYWRTK
jgi:hypothetical protein